MARRSLVHLARRYAVEIVIGCLVLGSMFGFYAQRRDDHRIAQLVRARAADRAAEVRALCEEGNQAKDDISATLHAVFTLSQPLTARDKAFIARLNMQLRPTLSHRDCTKIQ